MKKRLAIRASEADRVEATKEADLALASFITALPEKLQLPVSDMNQWQAILHLTYNNFLILLHRPPPRSTGETTADTASDLSICWDAVSAITTIFDAMRAKNNLSKLWMPSIYVLFTALVHLSSQVTSPNPLVVARSKRLYSSLILTLHELSSRWLYAKSLLRLFDRGATQERQRTMAGEAAAAAAASAARDMGDGASFTLRPSGPPIGIEPPAVIPPGFSNDIQPYGLGPAYPVSTGQIDPVFGTFGDPNIGFSADGNDVAMLPALEVLLAGIGSDFDFEQSMEPAAP